MNRGISRFGSLAAIIFALAATAAFGCGGEDTGPKTGKISGTVELEDAEDASGVVVSAGSQRTTTDANGEYLFVGLEASRTLDVEAVRDGYEAGKKSVTIQAGRTVKANFELELANHEPTIDSLEVAEPTLKPRQETTVTAEVTDADEDDELQYQWSSTEGFTVSADEDDPSKATVQAPDELRTEGSVTLRVTDKSGVSVEATASVQTFEGYRPELGALTANPSTLQPKGKAVLTTSATDRDGDDVTIKWSTSDEWTLSASEGEQVEVTAPDKYRASARIDVVAEDSTGLKTSDSINLVTGENATPNIRSVKAAPSQTEAGGTIDLSVAADDPRGDELSYKWSLRQGMGWSIAEPTKATTTVSAPDKYGATAVAVVEVSDGYGATVKREMVISTVSNDGPQITSMTATPSTVERAGTIELHVEATDPNGDNLTYSWDVPKEWSLTKGSTTNPKLTAPGKPGETATISVRVTDSSGKIARASTVVSTRPNNPPLVTSFVANPNKVEPGGKIAVSASATDPDGDELTYKWSAAKNWTVSGSGAAVDVVAPDKYGETGIVTLTVSDVYGGSTRVQILLRTLRNAAPTITSVVGTPNPVTRGGTVDLKVSANDPNGDTLGYTWSVDKPNDWSLSGNGDKATLTAPNQPGMSTTVTVKADDGSGGSDTGTLRVKTGANQLPSITSVPPRTDPTAGRFPWRYDVEARDADKDTLTYALAGNPPKSVSIDKSTGVIEWWPTHSDEGRFKFDVEVDDGFDTVAQTIQGTVGAFDMRDVGPASDSYDDGMAIGDFNGDGRDDIATVDTSRGNIKVILSTKSGFGVVKTFSNNTGMRRCYGLDAGDVDNDKDVDLVVGCQRSSWYPGYRIWLNKGNGTFRAGANAHATPYDRPTPFAAVELGDLNADGLADLVLVARDGSMTSWVNNQSGRFVYRAHSKSNATARDAELTDVTGDGRPELVVASHKSDNSTGYVNVWTMKSNGSFDNRSRLADGKCFYHVSAGKFDGDKDVDLAVADRCTGKVHTLLNGGNGNFSFHKSTSVGPAQCISGKWSFRGMGTSDFDGDGHLDWAVGQDCNANGRFYVAFGDGKAGFSETRSVKAGALQNHYTHAVGIGDWDTDKRNDIFIWSDSSNNPLQVAY